MNVKEKGPQELALQADREEIVLTQSISQNGENIPFSFAALPPTGYLIALDSFSGTVKDFRSYLKVKRKLLEAGVIAP